MTSEKTSETRFAPAIQQPATQSTPASPPEAEKDYDALDRRGQAAYFAGRFDEARRCFAEGLRRAKAESPPDNARSALFLNRLGLTLWSIGELEDARRSLDASLTLIPTLTIEPARRRARLLGDLVNAGGIATDQSDYAGARGYLRHALAEAKKEPLSIEFAFKAQMAIVYVELQSGDPDAALDGVHGAESLLDAHPAELAALRHHALRSRANVYAMQSDPEQALRYYDLALKGARDNGDAESERITLQNRANLRLRLGSADAQKAAEQDLRLVLDSWWGDTPRGPHGNNPPVSDHPGAPMNPVGYAGALVSLGSVAMAQRNFDEAARIYAEALARHERLGNAHGIALCRTDLAAALTERKQMGDRDEAMKLNSAALAFYDGGSSGARSAAGAAFPSEAAYCHWNLAELSYLRMLEARGASDSAGEKRHGQESRGHYEASRRLLEALGDRVADPETSGTWSRQQIGTLYARCARFAAADDGPLAGAASLELGRGRLLSLQVSLAAVPLERLLAPGEAATLASHESRVASTRAALRRTREQTPSALAPNDASPDAAAPEMTAVVAAERDLAAFRQELYRRHSHYARAQAGHPLDVAGLRALLRAEPDTLFLECTLDGARSALVIALAGGRTEIARAWPVTIPASAPSLIDRTDAWAARLSDVRALDEGGHDIVLFSTLLGDVERAGLLAPGRFARIVVVTDGALRRIPFGALRRPDGRRLIETHAVSSSVALSALRYPRPQRKPASGSVLCVLGPAGDARTLPRIRAAARPLALNRPGGGVLEPSGTLTRPALIDRLCAYDHLLFALHGELDSRNGLRSRLLFAPSAGAPGTAQLLAADLLTAPLCARSVFLAACETGAGTDAGGEGLMGFSWALLAAGCRSVVAPRWKVEDAATAELITAYHAALFAGGRADDALRAAILSLRRKPAYRRPFYWAGFDLVGDGRALFPAPRRPTPSKSGR